MLGVAGRPEPGRPMKILISSIQAVQESGDSSGDTRTDLILNYTDNGSADYTVNFDDEEPDQDHLNLFNVVFNIHTNNVKVTVNKRDDSTISVSNYFIKSIKLTPLKRELPIIYLRIFYGTLR